MHMGVRIKKLLVLGEFVGPTTTAAHQEHAIEGIFETGFGPVEKLIFSHTTAIAYREQTLPTVCSLRFADFCNAHPFSIPVGLAVNGRLE